MHIPKLCRRFSEDLLAIAIPSSPGCSLNLELRKWIEEQEVTVLLISWIPYVPRWLYNVDWPWLIYRASSLYFFLNPLDSGWACWSDEDYVGRLCRLARRCNAGNLVGSMAMHDSCAHELSPSLWSQMPENRTHFKEIRLEASWSVCARLCMWESACCWELRIVGMELALHIHHYGAPKTSRTLFFKTSTFSNTSRNQDLEQK